MFLEFFDSHTYQFLIVKIFTFRSELTDILAKTETLVARIKRRDCYCMMNVPWSVNNTSDLFAKLKEYLLGYVYPINIAFHNKLNN